MRIENRAYRFTVESAIYEVPQEDDLVRARGDLLQFVQQGLKQVGPAVNVAN